MPYSESARVTLLKWLNEFLPFTLDRQVEKLEDLSDGFVFAQILRDIDPDYDISEIEKNAAPSAWLNHRRNLQSVYKALFRYIRKEDDPGFKDQHYEYLVFAYDFRAIAENPDTEGLFQLLSVFVAVACSFPNNSRYINLIQKMGPHAMIEIKTILDQKVTEANEAEKIAQLEETIHDATQNQDPDLVAEAQRAAFRAREDALLKKNADLNGRIEHLQLSLEDMREKNEKIEQELDMLREAHSQNESDQLRSQNARIKEQEEYIANIEGHLNEATELKNKIERENHQLSLKASKAEHLQDEVQELKYLNEELSKKANTVDRYKQKLESLKAQESQMKSQQYEIDDLKSRIASEEALQSKIKQLEANQRRFQDRQQSYELEIVELSSQKRALEHDLLNIRHLLDSTRDKLILSENYIAELQQDFQPGDRRQSSDSPQEDANGAFNLEQELQNTSDPTTAYHIEISRLKAENQFLRDSMGATSESSQLRNDLEMSVKKHDLMKEKYVEIYDKYAAGQRQLDAMKQTLQGEGAEAFEALQKNMLETGQELDQAKKKAKDLEEKLADKDRELLSVKTDFTSVEKSSTDALEALKATDELISTSLKSELETSRKQVEILELEVQQQKEQLLRALMSKDELREQLEKLGSLPPPPPPATDENASRADKEAQAEYVKKTNEAIEKLRERVILQKEQLKKAEQEKLGLQRRLKAAEQAGGNPEHKAAAEQKIKNLQRENAMIATAWYDLTSRLQSNHVVLQRRQDMPKSWINKQRQMVNATPRR